MAFWSEFSGAFAAQVHSVCASVTAVYLPFFVFGRELTRLDYKKYADINNTYTGLIVLAERANKTGLFL